MTFSTATVDRCHRAGCRYFAALNRPALILNGTTYTPGEPITPATIRQLPVRLRRRLETLRRIDRIQPFGEQSEALTTTRDYEEKVGR